MCRLFAIYSTEPTDASYPLVKAPQSLLALSHIDKKRLQGDGWGVGWYENGRPRVIKSPRAMYRDLPKVRQAAKQAKGPIILGHVRWASNPLKLKKSDLIGLEHTQPFTHNEWLFIHNGTLYIPREVTEQLGYWKKFIKGKNDSEVLFYWLLKTVVNGKGRWADRVRTSLQELDRIWRKCKSRYPLYKHPYHGLNWVLTNGQIILSFCFVDPSGQAKIKALANRKQPYYQMQLTLESWGTALASEPLNPKKYWSGLRHGSLILIRKRGRHTSTSNMKVFL